jgi:ABC-type glutathione transport system ATPase component
MDYRKMFLRRLDPWKNYIASRKMFVIFDFCPLTVHQTHNVAIASSIADFVVLMGKNGRILDQGLVSNVIAKDKSLAAEVSKIEEAAEKAEMLIDSEGESEVKQADGKLIIEEEIEEGHVSKSARTCF